MNSSVNRTGNDETTMMQRTKAIQRKAGGARRAIA
jgi:hypothetical protein